MILEFLARVSFFFLRSRSSHWAQTQWVGGAWVNFVCLFVCFFSIFLTSCHDRSSLL